MPVSAIPLTPGGPSVSHLIWGLWRLAEWKLSASDLLRQIHRCIDLGITTVDHADIYGEYECEHLFGMALSLEPSLRDQLQIVTKCGIKLPSPNRPHHATHHYDTSVSHIISSAENSLRALQTDRIDVLLIHRPDPMMNADEIAEAFTSLRSSGKVRHFGVSNFLPLQVDLLASRLDFPLVTNQVECSVLNFGVMHDGTLDHAQQYRYVPMAWSPFAGGQLFRGMDERNVRVRNALEKVGAMHDGAPIDQISLAWLLSHPSSLLPVIGTGNEQRIRSAVQAATLKLTREQWFMIWTASMGSSVP